MSPSFALFRERAKTDTIPSPLTVTVTVTVTAGKGFVTVDRTVKRSTNSLLSPGGNESPHLERILDTT